MIIASWKGRLEVARLLLEAGADKDSATEDGTTSLGMASHDGHLIIVLLLLEANADKDKANNNGPTQMGIQYTCDSRE